MPYKILNLILYSSHRPKSTPDPKDYDQRSEGDFNSNEYIDMYSILRNYLQTYRSENFDFYFYSYEPSLDKDFEIKDDIIHIKGNESFIPGILEKTISVFQYSLKFEYDYLVRTNISTIVDWNKFLNLLDNHDIIIKNQSKNIIYGGGFILNLDWVNFPDGIVDDKDKYEHQKFVSGTCILLSRPAIELISNSNNIYNTIDDVAIGLFFYPKYTNKLIDFSKYFKWNQEYSKDGIIYRNRTDDRSEDVKRMERICDQILYKKEIKNISMSSKYLQERNLGWKKYF